MSQRYLLSIDSGGIRGIIPAVALVKLESITGKLTRDIFSFVAGTSTGAIIAAAIAAGVPAARILDFYHLATLVPEAANACLGEGTPEAAAWARARLGEAKRRGPGPLLAAAAALGRSVRSPAKREALRRLRGYVADRLDMLDYPAARRRGWDIGSGPTEAAGKNLALRVRGVGMKWDLDHAAAMMNLKALYESGQATHYWAKAAEPCLN